MPDEKDKQQTDQGQGQEQKIEKTEDRSIDFGEKGYQPQQTSQPQEQNPPTVDTIESAPPSVPSEPATDSDEGSD